MRPIETCIGARKGLVHFLTGISMALLRLPDVTRLSGYSRSMLYALISQGLFPRQIKIGERAVAWPSQEVESMVASIVSQQSVAERRELVKKLEAARTRVTSRTDVEMGG